MNYISKLKKIVKTKKSNLIIGLDIDIKKIPKFFLSYDDPLSYFNKTIITETRKLVAGYKFNMAFYEVLKNNGMNILEKSLSLIPDDCVTICDAKRGDISNTNEMYARIYFENFNFDAVTLSPYLGTESVYPFLSKNNRFAYILALTSNPGSEDFQKVKISNKYLYELIVEKFLKTYGSEKVGFVFGANHYKEIKIITSKIPSISLLIPGIGAQGIDLTNLLKGINNKVFLINSSRGIIYDNNINIRELDYRNSLITKTMTLNKEINIKLMEL